MQTPIAIARGIVKQYTLGENRLTALNGIDIKVFKGDFIAIMGTSGSGKSTLLNILGCLDRPTKGEYHFNGIDVLSASDNTLSALRAKKIGFVFQLFNVLPSMNIYDNVALPFHYAPIDRRKIKQRVTRAIDAVGLSDCLFHKTAQLSGGEVQRVAIARALAIEPEILLADEPTGNLDSTNSQKLLTLLKKINESGVTIIMVTHDKNVAAYAHEIRVMQDGCFI